MRKPSMAGKQNPSVLSAPVQETRQQPDPPARKVGKSRGGKSRDANGKQHTVLLEKETHLTALDLLRRHYEGQDRSDLLNRLLKEWVKRHAPRA
jgi:hypothetical protein